MAKVSWIWGGKRYYGTLIPSRETKTHRFARTENGMIKKLPKKKSKTHRFARTENGKIKKLPKKK
jgi:hypothetical protein